jgi:hypothetical protein
MTGWDVLLDRLAEVPRENGTPALDATAGWLAATLRAGGVGDVTLVPFTAHPWRLRLAGVLILAGTLLYAVWLRRGRAGRALAIALLLPVVVLAELDFFLPVFGWPGAREQHHVVARIPAAARAERRLLFTAHFDTKTDLLDHVARAPIDLLGLPVAALLIAGALAARRAPRGRALGRLVGAAGWVAPLWGAGAFAALTAGAFVGPRSPGALDDGAACAVLVRLAERLAAEPLGATDVEVVLFSAEELGVEGSWRYASRRFAAPLDLPTAAVNLEVIGASEDLALVRRESFTLRGWAPDAGVVALLDGTHRRLRGRTLPRTPFGGGTDARSLLAHGVPAATLVGVAPAGVFFRGLHSARDERARVDVGALERVLEYLLAVARAADEPPEASGVTARTARARIGEGAAESPSCCG